MYVWIRLQTAGNPTDAYAAAPAMVMMPAPAAMGAPSPVSVVPNEQAGAAPASAVEATQVASLEELMGWVRHGKFKKVKEGLESLPNRRFDPALVTSPYIEDFGTAYLEAYEREAFNVNKVRDERICSNYYSNEFNHTPKDIESKHDDVMEIMRL